MTATTESPNLFQTAKKIDNLLGIEGATTISPAAALAGGGDEIEARFQLATPESREILAKMREAKLTVLPYDGTIFILHASGDVNVDLPEKAAAIAEKLSKIEGLKEALAAAKPAPSAQPDGAKSALGSLADMVGRAVEAIKGAFRQ